MTAFQVVHWGDSEVSYYDLLPQEQESTPIRAALVFALTEAGFLLADIPGRGWCIPGGHTEAGETPEMTARREAYEEAGLLLGALLPIGCFVIKEPASGESWRAPSFVARVVSMDEIPAGSESLGRCTVSLEALPDRYYMWDTLLESVFQHALRRLSSGQ